MFRIVYVVENHASAHHAMLIKIYGEFPAFAFHVFGDFDIFL